MKATAAATAATETAAAAMEVAVTAMAKSTADSLTSKPFLHRTAASTQ